MADETNGRKIPRHPRVWWSRWHYRWPFLVWLAGAIAVACFYVDTGRTVQIMGAVEILREEAAPMESARLTKINVIQGQEIKAGDIVAEFDATILDANMADIKSQLASDQFQYATKTAELQAQFELDRIQLERQYAFAMADAEVRLRDLGFRQASDSNRLDALRAQIKFFDPVITTSSADVRSLGALRADEESLARTISLYPSQIQQALTDLYRLRQQLEASRKKTYEGAATNSIAAQERASAARDILASLRQRKESYVLRARNDGTVSRVIHLPGDVVKAADPVVTIVVKASQHIVAFVPESIAHDITIGHDVWLARPFHTDPLLPAKIITMAPEVLGLPTRAAPIPGQTVRGRRCTLVASGSNDFLPGESIGIYLNRPWWTEQVIAFRKKFGAR